MLSTRQQDALLQPGPRSTNFRSETVSNSRFSCHGHTDYATCSGTADTGCKSGLVTLPRCALKKRYLPLIFLTCRSLPLLSISDNVSISEKIKPIILSKNQGRLCTVGQHAVCYIGHNHSPKSSEELRRSPQSLRLCPCTVFCRKIISVASPATTLHHMDILSATKSDAVRMHCALQEDYRCCSSCHLAASKGHADCYKDFLRDEPRGPGWTDVYRSVSLSLQRGHEEFVTDLFNEREDLARVFVMHCIWHDDVTALKVMVGLNAGIPGTQLARLAASARSVKCLRLALKRGDPWDPVDLLHAARGNRLDILEVVLKHTDAVDGWCPPKLPPLASVLGNLRFLMRMFERGCPMWAVPDDNVTVAPLIRQFSLIAPNQDELAQLVDWTLTVSSDLGRSGPVLLYAAKHAPRMTQMLADVRRRALALLCCFHRAHALSREPGPQARRWAPMGHTPVEVVERIATLARMSIIVDELID